MKERYRIIKKLYKDYLVFIIKNDKYRTFARDLDIFTLIYHRDLDKLTDINYIVLDGLEIIKIQKVENNNYYSNLKKVILINVIEKYRSKKLKEISYEEKENDNNNN